MKSEAAFSRVTPQVAIYVRLSDEDKNKTDNLGNSESIKNQIALATKYANEKKWVIHDIYIDDDWSGLDRDRPEFNRLLKDCEARKIDIVLCKDMSRFTRDKIVTEEYLETKFIEWGIRFIGLSDGVDTSDKANKKSREINALVNQWYAEDISIKVKDTLKIKRETGNFIGSFPPYGYKKSAHNKNKLEIDEVAAKTVRMIFQLYLEGYGTTAIAKILNAKQIPNPCTYKELTIQNYKNPFKKKSTSVWNKTSVKRILRNEVYLGILQQHKSEKIHFKSKKRKQVPKKYWTVVKNTHPPIIDKATFFTVQKLMDTKIRSSGYGKAHIFAGKVFCKDCKSPLTKSSSGKYSYLSCALYNSSHLKCSRHSIRFDRLIQIVEDRLRRHLLILTHKTDDLVQEVLEKGKLKKEEQNYQVLKKNIIKRINDLNNGLKYLYIDKANKTIEEVVWQNIFEQFTNEKKILIQELKRLNTEEKDTSQINIKVCKKAVNDILQVSPLNRTLINNLIDFIEVGEVENGKQEIIISYTFCN